MPRILRTLPAFTYGSLCSGIEAATTAWHPLGWKPAFFSEIEPFPSAVLAHHWPEVPNMGDMTKHKEWNLNAKIDLLVGGTPCQAFSVAGLRNGLADARGNLTLTFIDIADQFDPDWIVWENVPGVLSSKDNAFGCFLGGLAGEDDALLPPGGKWTDAGCVFGPTRTIAWRILDAQHFQLAQRRRRVFVVASPRHREGPCAVLFEREGVRRDSPPSREKGEGFTHPVAPCIGASGRGFERGGDTRGQDPVVATFWNGEQVTQTLDAVLAKGQTMPEKNRFPAVLVPATTHTLKAEGFDASEDGTGRGVPLVPVAYRVHGEHSTAMQGDGIARVADPVEVARCLDSCGGYATNQGGNVIMAPVSADGTQPLYYQHDWAHGRVYGTDGVAPAVTAADGAGGKNILAPVAYDDRNQAAMEDLHHTLRADGCGSRVGDAVAFEPRFVRTTGGQPSRELNPCLRADLNSGDGAPCVATAMQVRRLLPVECERLQGFPDDHTLIPWRKKPASECPDGPRYKAIGNSMAVPVMNWIGRRINLFMEGTL